MITIVISTTLRDDGLYEAGYSTGNTFCTAGIGKSPDEAVGQTIRELWLTTVFDQPVLLRLEYDHMETPGEEQDGDRDLGSLPHGFILCRPEGGAYCQNPSCPTVSTPADQTLLDTQRGQHFCCRECLDQYLDSQRTP